MADTNHLLGELFYHLGVCKVSGTPESFSVLIKKSALPTLDHEARYANERPPVWEELKALDITPEAMAAWGSGRVPGNWRNIVASMHAVLRGRGVTAVAPASAREPAKILSAEPQGMPADFSAIVNSGLEVAEVELRKSQFNNDTLPRMPAVQERQSVPQPVAVMDMLPVYASWLSSNRDAIGFAVCMFLTAQAGEEESRLRKKLLPVGVTPEWLHTWARVHQQKFHTSVAWPDPGHEMRIVKQLLGSAVAIETMEGVMEGVSPSKVVRWMSFATLLITPDEAEALAQMVRDYVPPPFGGQAFVVQQFGAFAAGTLPPDDPSLLGTIQKGLCTILKPRLQKGIWPP